MELVSKTQSLLTSLDDCVTVDDVISGGETLIIDCCIDHDLHLCVCIDHDCHVDQGIMADV